MSLVWGITETLGYQEPELAWACFVLVIVDQLTCLMAMVHHMSLVWGITKTLGYQEPELAWV